MSERVDILAAIRDLDPSPEFEMTDAAAQRLMDAIFAEDEADDIEAEVAEIVRQKFNLLIGQHRELLERYGRERENNRTLRWCVLALGVGLVVLAGGIWAGR